MTKKIAIKSPRTMQSESPDEWVINREGIKRLTFDVPLSFHARLKIASVKLGRSMGSIIEEGTTAYLDKELSSHE
jgi:hypothetical protein